MLNIKLIFSLIVSIVTTDMQFLCERQDFYQSTNVATIKLSRMIQLNGSNYASKVSAHIILIFVFICTIRTMTIWHLFNTNSFNIHLFAEPFDRSNTARSCCDEKIFDRIKKIFYESWHSLRETKDLDRLFGEALAPPAFCTFYDNYTPMIYQPMDYILR